MRLLWWRRPLHTSSIGEQTLKYYLYISDAKVDMLYPQIPQPLLKRIAAELQINLNVLGTGVGATLKTDQEATTRYSKLSVIVRYLEHNMVVGTLDAPGSYFKATLPMSWGPLHSYVSLPGQVVYFGGATERVVIGLGGSMKHLIGKQVSPESEVPWGSGLPDLLAALEMIPTGDMAGEPRDSGLALWEAASTTLRMQGPKQTVEFLAKTLLEGQVENVPGLGQLPVHVVLGTPIYVALAS